MKRILTIIATSLLLSGCAQQTYFYNGQKYETAAQFRSASSSDRSSYISQIKPLPSTLSNKRLVLSLPSREYMFGEKLSLARKFDANAQMSAIEADPLLNDYYEFLQSLPTMIERKNLFSSVDARKSDGPSAIQPSKDFDVITLEISTTPGGRDEFYYINEKNGKQIVQADGSTATSRGRWDSFFDSIKAAVLR